MQDRSGLNTLFLAGFFVTVILALSSCTMITQQDFLALNDRVVALNARVNDLESSINKRLSQDVEAKIEPIRTNQAELLAELDKIKEQIQNLSGKVEENSLLIKRSVEKDTTGQDMVKATLAELTKRIEALESRVKNMGTKPSQEMAPARKVSPSPTQTAVKTEKDFYDEAMALYKEGKYQEAIGAFKDFLEKYPTSDLADNAQFWIGESYMAMKQYEKAILAYQEAIKKYPDGNKVPNAMLKQALAFYEIKDKVSARLLLKKIIRKYPNSNEAKIAAAKLKAIK